MLAQRSEQRRHLLPPSVKNLEALRGSCETGKKSH